MLCFFLFHGRAVSKGSRIRMAFVPYKSSQLRWCRATVLLYGCPWSHPSLMHRAVLCCALDIASVLWQRLTMPDSLLDPAKSRSMYLPNKPVYLHGYARQSPRSSKPLQTTINIFTKTNPFTYTVNFAGSGKIGSDGSGCKSGPDGRGSFETDVAAVERDCFLQDARRFHGARCRGYSGLASSFQGYVFEHGRKHAEAPAGISGSGWLPIWTRFHERFPSFSMVLSLRFF